MLVEHQNLSPDSNGRFQISRIPLAAVALAFVVGLITGRYLAMNTSFYAWLAGGALLAALATFAQKHLHPLTCLAMGVLIAALGAIHMRLSYFALETGHVVHYTGYEPQLATLRGRIVTAPTLMQDHVELGYRHPDRTGFLLQAEKIKTESGWASTCGLVRVIVQEPANQLSAGQQVEVLGTIGRYPPPDNPGQFDRQESARQKHTLVWMSAPCPEAVLSLDEAPQSWYAHVYWNLRAATRQHFDNLGDPKTGKLLDALLIGQRSNALDQLNRLMVRAGVAHFLSISGLHLGIFLAVVYFLCRLAQLSPRHAAFGVLIVLAGYLLIATPRAPLLRSAIMAAALCMAILVRRRYSVLNALAAAAIFLLIFDPLQLLHPGFQLSFLIVLALTAGFRPMREMLFGRWIRRRGLMVFRNDQRLARWTHYQLANFLMDFVTVAVLAYLAAVPLVAYHFGLFSPYAIPLSMLLFPLVVAVLVPGYLSLAAQWLLPGLSYSLAELAEFFAKGLAQVVEAFRYLPGLSMELNQVSLAWVLVCYLLLAALLFARKWLLGRLAIAALVVVLAGWTGISQFPASPPPTAELHLLSVGTGQCALLRSPGGQTWLIDAGTTGGFDLWNNIIQPFLRKNHFEAPRQAIVSHANTDHINGLITPLQDGLLKHIYSSESFGGRADSSYSETSFLKWVMDRRVSLSRLHAGQTVALDERTRIEVLWPPSPPPENLSVNDSCLVVKIVSDGRSVLLPADLNQPGLQSLMDSGQDLHADILLLPHHGGWDPALPEFIQAVNPGRVLISCGSDPAASSASDPRREAFYRDLYESRSCYRTDRDGAITVRFGQNTLNIRTAR